MDRACIKGPQSYPLIFRFGYIEFEDAAAAKAAFDKMNGEEVEGRPIKLDFASELQNAPSGDFRQGQWLGDKGEYSKTGCK